MNPCLLENRFVQIQPIWIALLDQRDLPLALPVLDLLFPVDRRFHGGCRFELDKQMYRVAVREAFDQPILVLMDASYQVAGHACVQRAILPAGHEVDEIGHRPIVWAAWIAGQARNDKCAGGAREDRVKVVIPDLIRDPWGFGRRLDCGSSPQ